MRAWLIVLLVLTGCSPAPAPDGITELFYASPYPPNHPFSRADQRWMAFVEQRSGGSLQIRPNWSGALMSQEHSMIELRHGVTDIGLITPIYVKGGTHLTRIQSGFYSGVRSIEQQVALFHCLARNNPQFERELAGLEILAVQGGNLPGIVSRERAVRSLDDLRGMRIRVPTELLNVMRSLGADPVNMPMGEVYSALAKGIIDAVVAPTDTFNALHLAEVADFYTRIAIPRGAYPARAISTRSWGQLSAEHQAVLEASVAVWETALAEENRQALEAGWATAMAAGVVESTISAADQARFEAVYSAEADLNASGLARYGIDGVSVLAQARASISSGGDIHCAGEAR